MTGMGHATGESTVDGGWGLGDGEVENGEAISVGIGVAAAAGVVGGSRLLL